MKKLDRYDIVKPLGQGAMGIVYEAYDPSLDLQVAIKTIRIDQLSEHEATEFESRFRTEARAAGRLKHPNIIGVYNFGREQGVAFLVMELVRGGDLKQLIDQGTRLTLDRIYSIMRDLLSALNFAHEKGILHRDVKPANLMLDPKGRVKLGDFGIAKISDASDGTRTQGTMIGTLKYMSPEQIQGMKVDSRSDLFAAGVVLYQLLTGMRPFDGEHDFAVMQAVINKEPQAPSTLNLSLPPSVDQVVSKALAKRADQRYATANEFMESLRVAVQQPAGHAGVTLVFAPEHDAAPKHDAPGGHPAGAAVPIGARGPAPAAVSQEIDLLYWKNIQQSADKEDFQDYLNRFPNGVYAARARQRLRLLAPNDNEGTGSGGASPLVDATGGRTSRPARVDPDATLVMQRPAAPDPAPQVAAAPRETAAALQAQAQAQQEAELARQRAAEAEARAQRLAEQEAQARLTQQKALQEAQARQAQLEAEAKAAALARQTAEAERVQELQKLQEAARELEAQREKELAETKARADEQLRQAEARAKEAARLAKEEADKRQALELEKLRKAAQEREVQLAQERAEAERLVAEKLREAEARVLAAEKAREEAAKREAERERKRLEAEARAAELARVAREEALAAEKARKEAEAARELARVKELERQRVEAEALAAKAREAESVRLKQEAEEKAKAERARAEAAAAAARAADQRTVRPPAERGTDDDRTVVMSSPRAPAASASNAPAVPEPEMRADPAPSGAADSRWKKDGSSSGSAARIVVGLGLAGMAAAGGWFYLKGGAPVAPPAPVAAPAPAVVAPAASPSPAPVEAPAPAPVREEDVAKTLAWAGAKAAERNDLPLAVRAYEHLAAGADRKVAADAARRLWEIYRDGAKGVPANMDTATKWYDQARRKGAKLPTWPAVPDAKTPAATPLRDAAPVAYPPLAAPTAVPAPAPAPAPVPEAVKTPAELYAQGQALEGSNRRLALAAYRQAAQQGHGMSQKRLWELLKDNPGTASEAARHQKDAWDQRVPGVPDPKAAGL